MKPTAAKGSFPYSHGALNGNWFKKHPRPQRVMRGWWPKACDTVKIVK